MKENNPTARLIIPKEGLLLQPGRVYLARTVERTFTDKYVPMLEGRSSVGRLGISVHVTAGFGDIGFNGHWTLEITVEQPTVIYPDVEICQIYYHTIKGDYDLYSSGKYQNNTGIQSSVMYKDFEKTESSELLNPAGKYLLKFAKNHSLSISEDYEQPMVKARFDFFNKTGL